MKKQFLQKIKLSFLSICMSLMMIIVMFPTHMVSAESGVVMNFTMNKKSYTINGVSSMMDTAPIEYNKRTMLPIVYVAKPIGAEVNWDSATQKVSISLEDTLIELWINNNVAKINGQDTQIDAYNTSIKPITMNGRTMLPLRFVAEKLGCEVGWNNVTQTITVTSGKEHVQKRTETVSFSTPQVGSFEVPKLNNTWKNLEDRSVRGHYDFHASLDNLLDVTIEIIPERESISVLEEYYTKQMKWEELYNPDYNSLKASDYKFAGKDAKLLSYSTFDDIHKKSYTTHKIIFIGNNNMGWMIRIKADPKTADLTRDTMTDTYQLPKN